MAVARDPFHFCRAARLLLGVLVGACAAGEDVTAFDLSFLPNANLNDSEQLRTSIAAIEVVVDNSVGLYETGDAQANPTFEIKNADDDPALELVVALAMPADRFPTLRLERGGLPERVDLRIRGLEPGGTTVAVGASPGLAFVQGDIVATSAPLNLLPQLLPLRVERVIPADGEALPSCVLGEVMLEFSKVVDVDTLTASGAVTIDPGPAISTVRVGQLGRVAYFTLANDQLTVGQAYQVTVATSVRDVDGNPLDQVPGEAGDQGFASTFSVPTGSPCAGGVVPWCWDGGTDCPSTQNTRVCVANECMLAGCEGASCGSGYVCHPDSFLCEPDCRLYGGSVVCDGALTCESTSGACR